MRPSAARPSPGVDGTPPVTPTEVPGERQVGRNTIETLLFRALSILSRLLGQLGLAVTARMRERDVELRRLVHRAPGLAVVLGGIGGGLATAVAVATGVETEIAVVAALALVPNVVCRSSPARSSGSRACARGTTPRCATGGRT